MPFARALGLLLSAAGCTSDTYELLPVSSAGDEECLEQQFLPQNTACAESRRTGGREEFRICDRSTDCAIVAITCVDGVIVGHPGSIADADELARTLGEEWCQDVDFERASACFPAPLFCDDGLCDLCYRFD